jgi:hypothetical protein
MKKDTMKMMRTAMYALLNNQLSYSLDNTNTLVPVYDEKRKVQDSYALYVLMSTQQETPDPVDGTWITDSSIDLEITQRLEFEVTKDDLDDVSNQIYALLEPAAGVGGLTAPAGFQIMNLQIASAVTRSFDISNTETVVSKVITVKAKVVQQL